MRSTPRKLVIVLMNWTGTSDISSIFKKRNWSRGKSEETSVRVYSIY